MHKALGIRCPEREDKVRQMIPFDARQGADHLFVARRNNSLSSTDRRWIFACVFAFSMTIALAFAAFGAWPVMPFTGLEMAVLYAAFRYVDRHAADYEIIEIRDDCVRLETRVGSQVQSMEFNRHWAQLVTKEGAGESRLALRSHGREIEFGRHLTSQDRERVARAIRRQLRRAS